jgi:FKBP-type peptidyl-prolyl cis-trans isomerase 2
MVIQEGAIVTMFYVLKDAQGNVLDDRYEHIPVRFIFGCGAIPPGLEKRLAGLRQGQRVTVVVPPEEGYGERRPEGVIRVRREDLPGHEEITVGDKFRLLSPDLESESATAQGYIGDWDFLESATVLGYIGDWVYLDCNHPYAGKELHYEVDIAHVRSL